IDRILDRFRPFGECRVEFLKLVLRERHHERERVEAAQERVGESRTNTLQRRANRFDGRPQRTLTPALLETRDAQKPEDALQPTPYRRSGNDEFLPVHDAGDFVRWEVAC